MEADFKSQDNPASWLKLELDRLQHRNHRYSLRAFAKLLGIGSGRLSEYLSGKRQLTVSAGEKIASKLNFDDELKYAFLKRIESVQEQNLINRKKRSKSQLISAG